MAGPPIEQWQCPSPRCASTVSRSPSVWRREAPPCPACGMTMMDESETARWRARMTAAGAPPMTREQAAAMPAGVTTNTLSGRATLVTPDAMVRLRALIGSTATTPTIDFLDFMAIAERLANPVEALRARIATASADDLTRLGEQLADLGAELVAAARDRARGGR